MAAEGEQGINCGNIQPLKLDQGGAAGGDDPAAKGLQKAWRSMEASAEFHHSPFSRGGQTPQGPVAYFLPHVEAYGDTDLEALFQKITHYCTMNSLTPSRKRLKNGLVVLAGIQAVLEVRPSAGQCISGIMRLREAYVADGTLIPEAEALRFTNDTEFSSPSAAAGAVFGGTANGLTAWKTEKGRTLQELEEK